MTRNFLQGRGSEAGRLGALCRRLLLAIVVVALAASLLAAGPAFAAERFAGPGGAGAVPCTNRSIPCDFRTAVTTAAAGDVVTALSGDYGTIAGGQVNVAASNVLVRGEPGRPRPILTIPAAYPGAALRFSSTSSVRYLDVRNPSGQGVFFARDIDQVIVRAGGTPSAACTPGDGGLVRNSICVATGSGGLAAGVAVGGAVPYTVTLRNVTAIATGANSVAVRSNAAFGAQATVNAINTIADGTLDDVSAQSNGSAGTTATVNIGYSNFATSSASGTGASVNPSPAGSNQTAAPGFVDRAAQNYHQAAGSPTIDAGITDPANGALDFEGEPRALGASTDIGADEFVPLAPPPPPPPPPPPDAPVVVSDASMLRTRFAVGAGPTALFAARRRRPPRGTELRYTLSEPAQVRIAFERLLPGRRVGRSCRALSRRVRRYRRCTRAVPVGTLLRRGLMGRNRTAFSGRIGRRALRRGNYRATITATDTGGNTSVPRRLTFTIVG